MLGGAMLTRVTNWVQRQLGSGATNLRLVWPEHWWQSGRDAPGSGLGGLSFPPLYTAIDVISSDIARLPLRHWRDDGESRNEVRDSWAVSVLDDPNDYQTVFDLIKQLTASVLYRGNGYLYPIRNGRHQIEKLHCLFPDYVWVSRLSGQADYFYQVGPQPLADLDTTVMVPPRNMFHHRILTLNDPLFGVSPLIAAAASCSAGLAILRSTDRFFNRMARPSGVLSTDKLLDEKAAERVKERFQRLFSGEEGAGDVAVLEQGLKWEALTMSAVDAQLIEQLRWTVEDVARVYRVPGFMIGDLKNVSYNSSEQLTRQYWNGCLSSHMRALEQRLSQFFGMDGRTEYLEFDLDQMFRAELLQRTEALTKSVQGGLRTPNEARRIEGLNALPGGDQIFMQQQMVPVEQLASRTDLTPKPPMMPAQAPQRELPPPPPLDPTTLTDALMAEVFAGAPPPRLPRLVYGRSGRTYH